MQKMWLDTFKDIGMVWKHDGHPRRPYAKLTSEKISDGFINCTPLIARQQLLDDAVRQLLSVYPYPPSRCVIVGQAMGSITIASTIARQCGQGALFCWSMKGNNEAMHIDPRFTLDTDVPAVIVEDVTTTGGTTSKTIKALQRLGVPTLPYIYTVVNRSGLSTIDGLEIRALVTLDIQAWDFGSNPHTANGMELVEAVRPKENWDALTRQY